MNPNDSATAAQDALDAAYRAAFTADERVRAVLTYGSRPAGLGDAWSDVEYWVFVAGPPPDQGWSDPADPAVPPRWLRDVGDPGLLVRNEFGAWVAVHAGLVRVEVHVWPASDVDVVRGWPARGAPVRAMVVLDRDGTLAPAVAALPEYPKVPSTAAEVAAVCGRFANWWVLGRNVAGRGEWERSQDALAHVRRELTWMARLAEPKPRSKPGPAGGAEPGSADATRRWLTPSRLAERDLSPEVVDALAQASARTEPADLGRAYAAAWELGERLWRTLAATWGFDPPDRLAEWIEAQASATGAGLTSSRRSRPPGG
ncbi:lincosamide nucleotidyltransferase [Actinopolymorpha cephalotaxi]|uniref:Lincosamide nucleotidyltransferase n=1 Tax=Actinopolymorpha cephalotaxi TaxID=504797 RepID=A0A1I2VYY4_9ACTN|nr:hypothetical protein [Actinopolymorpha cephalotaxi]NYH82832.1 lincosamide nucleotidyltransferase [Actinopolymorpha cephalotaxi]SFG94360.1 lincosamide nucleotidyltransferase [Actinopolymorpha cephalotaxi]